MPCSSDLLHSLGILTDSSGGHLSGCLSQVKLGRQLGKGTFGTTCMGRWRGGEVAVKSVHIKRHDEAESFLREVHVLACIRHPNVMPFCGMLLVKTRHAG